MIILYRIIIAIYGFTICLASLFNKKARAWCKGRKHYFQHLKENYRPGEKTVWFHCASLGEFEQGRPVIEALKEKKPELSIVVTFFSPSGYEIRKNYDQANYVLYLPLDTPRNVKRFLDILKPDLAVFVKYEFWYYYLTALQNRRIPVILISAIFRSGQWFFKGYGKKFRLLLNGFSRIFVQDEDSLVLLKAQNINEVQVAGDTRFDRVIDIALARKKISEAAMLKGDNLLVVAGSTWKEDEKILLPYINRKIRNYKWVIAPHEIYPLHLRWIAEKLEVPFLFFSEAKYKNPAEADVLIIDNIGMLSSLYAYANVAYIGGGFGKGIHNILEAAVFGVPVIFGPNYNKFREARELIYHRGAFSVDTEKKLNGTLNLFFDNEHSRKEAGKINKHFVHNSAGSTLQIVNNLLTFF